MNCAACNKVITTRESLKCTLCVGKYHCECLNIEKATFITLSEEFKSAWSCPACNNVTRRTTRVNDNTPVRQGGNILHSGSTLDMSCDLSDNSTITPLPSSAAMASHCVLNANGEVTMDKISALLDEKLHTSLLTFMESFRKALWGDVKEMVRTEMDAMVQTIKDDFTATTDFISAEQSTLRTDIDRCNATINCLQTENSQLQAQIVKLNSRLAGIEKMSRNCNIEIQAVPEHRNENVSALLKRLCEIVKVPLEDGHINSCRRVAKQNKASNRPRNIVVTFTTPRIRDLVLSASYKYIKAHNNRGLTSSDLGIAGDVCRVYVAEHLSPEQKTLHAAARKAAKDLQYKYVWVKYGQ
jgi:hypothetical protein